MERSDAMPVVSTLQEYLCLGVRSDPLRVRPKTDGKAEFQNNKNRP